MALSHGTWRHGSWDNTSTTRDEVCAEPRLRGKPRMGDCKIKDHTHDAEEQRVRGWGNTARNEVCIEPGQWVCRGSLAPITDGKYTWQVAVSYPVGNAMVVDAVHGNFRWKMHGG